MLSPVKGEDVLMNPGAYGDTLVRGKLNIFWRRPFSYLLGSINVILIEYVDLTYNTRGYFWVIDFA